MKSEKMISPNRAKVAWLLTLMLLTTASVQSVYGQPPPQADNAGIYSLANTMPELTGNLSLGEIIGGKVQYPREAKDKKIEGLVMIRFVVDEEGNISDAHAVSSPDKSLTDAALAAIINMPRWKPGENAGTPVKVYQSISVSFMMDYPKQTDDEKSLWSKIFVQGSNQNSVCTIFANGGC